jgi:hypothetical protein
MGTVCLRNISINTLHKGDDDDDDDDNNNNNNNTICMQGNLKERKVLAQVGWLVDCQLSIPLTDIRIELLSFSSSRNVNTALAATFHRTRKFCRILMEVMQVLVCSSCAMFTFTGVR